MSRVTAATPLRRQGSATKHAVTLHLTHSTFTGWECTSVLGRQRTWRWMVLGRGRVRRDLESNYSPWLALKEEK